MRQERKEYAERPIGTFSTDSDLKVARCPKRRLCQLEKAAMLVLEKDELVSEVVIRRLGLSGLQPERYEVIGQSLGLTVAGVWYAERQGYSLIQRLFTGGQAGGSTLPSELVAFAEQIRMAVRQAPRRDVVRLEDFRWALAGLLGFSPSLEEGIPLFFLDWCEVVIEPYDDGQTFVYRSQDTDSRALFKRHLSQVQREWQRGLRGQALARRCQFAARGLVVTLGQVLHLLGLGEDRLLERAS